MPGQPQMPRPMQPQAPQPIKPQAPQATIVATSKMPQRPVALQPQVPQEPQQPATNAEDKGFLNRIGAGIASAVTGGSFSQGYDRQRDREHTNEALIQGIPMKLQDAKRTFANLKKKYPDAIEATDEIEFQNFHNCPLVLDDQDALFFFHGAFLLLYAAPQRLRIVIFERPSVTLCPAEA